MEVMQTIGAALSRLQNAALRPEATLRDVGFILNIRGPVKGLTLRGEFKGFRVECEVDEHRLKVVRSDGLDFAQTVWMWNEAESQEIRRWLWAGAKL